MKVNSDIALFPLPCFPGYFSPLSLPAADAAVPYVKEIIHYLYKLRSNKRINNGENHTYLVCYPLKKGNRLRCDEATTFVLENKKKNSEICNSGKLGCLYKLSHWLDTIMNI
jgi:hypothetical protein